MKISEIITDKYKLRIPPTVYYDLLADVREVEEDQEPCEDISPTAIPVTVEEAKRLLLAEWKKEVSKDKSNNRLLVAYKMAVQLLEQEPKTGYWIRQDNTKEPLYGWYFCSECNSVIGDKVKFCSNCGARMEDKE